MLSTADVPLVVPPTAVSFLTAADRGTIGHHGRETKNPQHNRQAQRYTDALREPYKRVEVVIATILRRSAPTSESISFTADSSGSTFVRATSMRRPRTRADIPSPGFFSQKPNRSRVPEKDARRTRRAGLKRPREAACAAGVARSGECGVGNAFESRRVSWSISRLASVAAAGVTRDKQPEKIARDLD